MGELQIVAALSNVGAFAVLAYLMVKQIPQREERQTAAIEKMLVAFQAEQRFEREQCTAQFEKTMLVIQEILLVVKSNQNIIHQGMK